MEIQLWRSILCPYELAVKELTVKFKHMIEEYHENDRYSPIEQVSGRVKSVSSILEKRYPDRTAGNRNGRSGRSTDHLSV